MISFQHDNIIPKYLIAQDDMVQFRMNLVQCISSIFNEQEHCRDIAVHKVKIGNTIDLTYSSPRIQSCHFAERLMQTVQPN